jgi:hypothetical protein
MSREQKMRVVCFVTEERVKQENGRWEKTAFTLRVSVFVGARGLCLWPKIFLNQPAASLFADLDKAWTRPIAFVSIISRLQLVIFS